jgi:NADH pyrophosphatase NudC (nudix superfamily)
MYQWGFHVNDERLHPENKKAAYAFADQILSLINAERCVWTYDDWQIHGQDVYKTSCDMFEFYEGYTYCPKCGKRIEVKDANS